MRDLVSYATLLGSWTGVELDLSGATVAFSADGYRTDELTSPGSERMVGKLLVGSSNISSTPTRVFLYRLFITCEGLN